ncbi:trehalose synthase [Ilyomonas limi]|uniref:Trehalose synthase n=1 Tax=Ilyomonas limi TaxID=2575867 RepID=A0A4U3KTZ2_9BACT|nr:alpha-amylase family protein [Ilyomonas limi]TKK66005.1 trehalose synthase [Ilyomonas limi]
MIEDLWYKNAIIYSLNLETYMDFNGDGVGDFEGLARRLDYLHALGVDTIWLAPFQPTPNRDNGYDIKDYFGVAPRYGSSGDFVEFMHRANKMGFKVIFDLVVNHTSDEHPWFQQSRSDKHSPQRDWYVWSKEKPANIHDGVVFPGVQKSTWTYDKKAKAYYFHRFYHFQPDLNMDNEDVRTEVRRIMGYWLQLGIAGFRIDALPFMIESKTPESKYEKHFEYLQDMRRFMQWRRGDAVFLGEANVLPKDTEKYFADGDGVHLMFNFYVNQHMFYTLATADIAPLITALNQTKSLPPTAQWAQFLRNHDELDLGRLTDEQRQKVFDKFGPDKNMQLYGRGIRRRLASMLGNHQQFKLAYSLMFSLPGTPVIYYGDEIGMGEDLSLEERAPVRTPMQWSDDYQAGFSTAKKLVLPVIEDGAYGYQHVNVEAQRRDPDSLLNWITALIRLRKECPEIGWGEWEIIDVHNNAVLCICYFWKGNSLLILHNFDEKQYEIQLKLANKKSGQLIDLHKNVTSNADENGVYKIIVEAYYYRWFRVGDLTHLLHRGKQ